MTRGLRLPGTIHDDKSPLKKGKHLTWRSGPQSYNQPHISPCIGGLLLVEEVPGSLASGISLDGIGWITQFC